MKKVRVQVEPGIYMVALLVDDDDPTETCENCMRQFYNHPDMAKEESAWCINCNDEEYRKDMIGTPALGLWSLHQSNLGKIVKVIKRGDDK
jgi:hypothetical protein